VVVDPALLAEFFDFFVAMIDDGRMPPAAEVGETFTAAPEEIPMGRGHAAISFVPSNQVSTFTAASGDDLVLARIPGDDSEAHIGTLINIGIYWAISANTDHPEEAARFVEFMINNPAAFEHLGVERGVPLNVEVADAIEPTLNAVDNQQVDYIASLIAAGAGTNRGVPGQGQMPAFTNRAIEGVMFGQQSSLEAANQWIGELQQSIDEARP
jgi:multiple sugar transport system substrate-binding protein